MGQLGFYYDQSICVGCKTCQMACKDKHDLAVGQLFREVREVFGGNYVQEGEGLNSNVFAYWLSISCNHCQDPKCVTNCPTGAMYKRDRDGIVLHDDNKCIGCRYCIWSCPYSAPQYIEERGKVDKCDFCVDYLEKGEAPACVAACPVRALDFGELSELKKKYKGTNKIKELPDSNLTKPSIIIKAHKDVKY